MCLDKARRVLRSEGWTARSWQQDGLLVEGQLRAWECDGWSGNVSAKLRLESAMRRAEAAVADSVTVDGHEVKGLKVELLIKPFYQVAVEPTLARTRLLLGERLDVVSHARECWSGESRTHAGDVGRRLEVLAAGCVSSSLTATSLLGSE